MADKSTNARNNVFKTPIQERHSQQRHLRKTNLSETSQSQKPQKSVEVYDDEDGEFGRNTILTRSARMRKFKFYQYKPIQLSPKKPEPAVLLPRDDVVKGKVALVAEQSKELCELDEQIVNLENKIADLRSSSDNSLSKLDEIFELVNKKNDLLRRQMQLNILEQEKILEKANEELTKELRSLMNVDDSKKSQAELDRQKYLYEQSLALVNKRNELVYHLDFQEKGIEEDKALKESLKRAISETYARNKISKNNGTSSSQDQNCCIQ